MSQGACAMSADVFRKLDEAEKAARELDKASDGVNETIEKVQDRLKKLALGVTGRVCLTREETTFFDTEDKDEWGEPREKNGERRTYLLYGPHSGRWAFWLERGVYRQGPNAFHDVFDVLVSEDQPLELLQASREMRILALEQIPDVIDVLVNEAKDLAKTAKKAKKAATTDE